MTHSQIKRKIMWRIKSIYVLNQIFTPINLKLLGILILLQIGGKLVFVSQVFRNMPVLSDVGGIFRFSYTTLANTEFAVQITLFAGVAMSIWFCVDVMNKFGLLTQVSTK